MQGHQYVMYLWTSFFVSDNTVITGEFCCNNENCKDNAETEVSCSTTTSKCECNSTEG
jgi:hypothetical protein